MLLKGAHDKVMVNLVDTSPQGESENNKLVMGHRQKNNLLLNGDGNDGNLTVGENRSE